MPKPKWELCKKFKCGDKTVIMQESKIPMVPMCEVVELLQGWHDGILHTFTRVVIDKILRLPRFSKGNLLKKSYNKDSKLTPKLIAELEEYREILLAYKMAVEKSKK